VCKGNPRNIRTCVEYLHDHTLMESADLLKKKLSEDLLKKKLSEEQLSSEELPSYPSKSEPLDSGPPPEYEPKDPTLPPDGDNDEKVPYVPAKKIPPSFRKKYSSESFDIDGQLVWFDVVQGNAHEEVNWLQLKSRLQRLFKETTGITDRPLRDSDWNKMGTNKLGVKNQTVHIKFFAAFWPQFQIFLKNFKVMEKYWSQNLIQGLIGRNFARQHFQNRRVGTFLLRFTENVMNGLAIDYVNENHKKGKYVDHLQIYVDANTGKCSLKLRDSLEMHSCETLEELILSVTKWTHLYNRAKEEGTPKDEVFRS